MKMQTENVVKAQQAAGFLLNDLRAAHADAVQANEQFGEMILLDLLSQAHLLHDKLQRVASAAQAED